MNGGALPSVTGDFEYLPPPPPPYATSLPAGKRRAYGEISGGRSSVTLIVFSGSFCAEWRKGKRISTTVAMYKESDIACDRHKASGVARQLIASVDGGPL